MTNLIFYLQNEPSGWQTLSWQAAVIFGFIAAFVALFNAVWGLRQRSKDLRWKQAELGRELIDEIYDFEPSRDALLMIDESEEEIKINKKVHVVTSKDVNLALTLPVTDNDEKSKYIRRSFEALFYYLDRIEQSINIGVVKFEDIRRPSTVYYVERLALQKYLISEYLTFTKYQSVGAFLDRFSEWKSK